MNVLGIYAVHIVNTTSIMIPTRWWFLYRATFPVTPLNSPSVMRTVWPSLNLLISPEATIMSSTSAAQMILRLSIWFSGTTNGTLTILLPT